MHELPLFLGSVIFISMSGVMAPGPVFTVTIAKGHKSPREGLLIGTGHGLVEIPLILLLYFGFSQVFANDLVKLLIGIVGGVILFYFGMDMLRKRSSIGEQDSSVTPAHGSIMAGILATSSNPYYFLWWATVGVVLIATAHTFGILGMVLFIIAHVSCDLFWYFFVGYTVFKSKRLWTPRVHSYVFGLCGMALMGFGVWFVISALEFR